jgi:hypothetical protein
MEACCTGARSICKIARFMLESSIMSLRFYVFATFFSRLAAEGTG